MEKTKLNKIKDGMLLKKIKKNNGHMPKSFIHSILQLKEILNTELLQELSNTINNLPNNELIFNRFFYIDYSKHWAYKDLISNEQFTENEKKRFENNIQFLIKAIKYETKLLDTKVVHFKTAKELEFDTKGYAMFKWNKNDKIDFMDYIKPFSNYLKNIKKNKNYDGSFSQTYITLTQSKYDKSKTKEMLECKPEIITKKMQNILKKSGLIDVIKSRHKNKNFKIKFIGLHHHDADTDFIDKSNMMDNGYIAKSKYFHIDTTNRYPPYKVLIYLNSIDEINEATFRILPYSYNCFNILERCIRKTTDITNEGLKYDKEGRSYFMKRPEMFRIRGDFKSDFGDTEIEKYALENEVLVGSKKENPQNNDIILFNNNSWHRGCLFNKNSKSHRQMLQVWFDFTEK